MKLYFTAASPYARLAWIVVVEKQLEGRVEFVLAQTRVPDSPYYAINPSGRVPYLVCDDGTGLEDSALICAYLDHLDGAPAFEAPPGRDGWDLRRLEALARSMLDGLSVWARESNRLEDERSPIIIEHERQRSRRMAGLWENSEIDDPLMRGPINMAQITLIAAFQMNRWKSELELCEGHPKLSDWAKRMAARPSLRATALPAGT